MMRSALWLALAPARHSRCWQHGDDARPECRLAPAYMAASGGVRQLYGIHLAVGTGKVCARHYEQAAAAGYQ